MPPKKQPTGRGRGTGPLKDGPYSRALGNVTDVPVVRPPNIDLEQVADDTAPEPINAPADETRKEPAKPKANKTNESSEDLNQDDIIVADDPIPAEPIYDNISNVIGNLSNLSFAEVETDGNNSETVRKDETRKESAKPKADETLDDILDNSELSAYAREFVPFVFLTPPLSNEEVEDIETRQLRQAKEQDLTETVNFCYSKIKEHPACLEDVLNATETHLVDYLKNRELRELIVIQFYEHALNDRFFSYAAVKFLTKLISLEKSVYRSVELRSTVLKLARTETEKYTTHLDSDGNLIAVLLYHSELYMQLDLESGRLVLIAVAVVEILKHLIQCHTVPFDDRISMVYQIVKLIGRTLDEDNPTIIDNLYTIISRVIIEGNLPIAPLTDYMLQFLENQRRAGWPDSCVLNDNRNDNSDEEQNNEARGCKLPMPPHSPQPAGVMYGPDGVSITDDEHSFLLEGFNENYPAEENPSYNAGMDPEMADAYEEFLVYSDQVCLNNQHVDYGQNQVGLMNQQLMHQQLQFGFINQQMVHQHNQVGLDNHQIAYVPSQVGLNNQQVMPQNQAGLNNHQIAYVPNQVGLNQQGLPQNQAGLDNHQIAYVPNQVGLNNQQVMPQNQAGLNNHQIAYVPNQVGLNQQGLPQNQAGLDNHQIAYVPNEVGLNQQGLPQNQAGLNNHQIAYVPNQVGLNQQGMPQNHAGLGNHQIAYVPNQVGLNNQQGMPQNQASLNNNQQGVYPVQHIAGNRNQPMYYNIHHLHYGQKD